MAQYRYQIRYIGAPVGGEGEVIAELDTLAAADAYWRRHIAVGKSAAPLDHAMTVTDGKTVWSMEEAPDDALRGG